MTDAVHAQVWGPEVRSRNCRANVKCRGATLAPEARGRIRPCPSESRRRPASQVLGVAGALQALPQSSRAVASLVQGPLPCTESPACSPKNPSVQILTQVGIRTQTALQRLAWRDPHPPFMRPISQATVPLTSLSQGLRPGGSFLTASFHGEGHPLFPALTTPLCLHTVHPQSRCPGLTQFFEGW